jgi:hypothetical protein
MLYPITAALIFASISSILTPQRGESGGTQGLRQQWVAWTLLALYDWSQRIIGRKSFRQDDDEGLWKPRSLRDSIATELIIAGLYTLSRALLGPFYEYTSWLVVSIRGFLVNTTYAKMDCYSPLQAQHWQVFTDAVPTWIACIGMTFQYTIS